MTVYYDYICTWGYFWIISNWWLLINKQWWTRYVLGYHFFLPQELCGNEFKSKDKNSCRNKILEDKSVQT